MATKKIHMLADGRWEPPFTLCGKRSHLIDARTTRDDEVFRADPHQCRVCARAMAPAPKPAKVA